MPRGERVITDVILMHSLAKGEVFDMTAAYDTYVPATIIHLKSMPSREITGGGMNGSLGTLNCV